MLVIAVAGCGDVTASCSSDEECTDRDGIGHLRAARAVRVPLVA
jgi:hypothetical protein